MRGKAARCMVRVLAFSAFVFAGTAFAQPIEEAEPTPPAATTAVDSEESVSQSSRRNSIEEIVVSARKRIEKLEETPVSVTAIGENTLREAGVTRIEQIQDLVPNLAILTGDSNAEARLVIRGVGTSKDEMAFDPGVGIFVDGVFMPRSVGSLLDVVDIEQIEVLRGPQGTLFGKNTVGGALNITTIKPKDEIEGFALLRPGTRGTLTARATINVPIDIGPLEDRLFVRAAFASVKDGGYVENVPRNQLWSNRNTLAFLGSLRWVPIDDLTIDLSGSWSRDHSYASGAQCTFIQETPLANVYPPPDSPDSVRSLCLQSERFKNWSNVAQLSDVVSYGTWMTANWDIGELLGADLSLKSITAWREQTYRLRQDFDGTPLEMVRISDAGGSPTDGSPGFQQQIQQEFQVNALAFDDRLDIVAGYFVFWDKGRDNRAVLSGYDTAIKFGKENITTIDNWTWAIFSQGTFAVTDWLSLTGGLRYSEDKKGLTQENVDPFNPAIPPQTAPPKDAIYSSWTPMGTISAMVPEDWTVDTAFDSILTYFTYSRGFKGGGFNGVLNPNYIELTGFEPETLDSFEVGFKVVALEQRLMFNFSAFAGLYDDIQVTTLRDLTEEGAFLPNLVQITQNAAAATTRGIEIETILLPFEGFRVDGSVGLFRGVYGDFPEAFSNLTGANMNRAGEGFPFMPELQTHLGMQYSLEVELPGPQWMSGWLTPRLDWSYQSAMHFEGPEVWSSHQPGFNLLHLRLSYDFLGDQAQIALWGKNVTDQEYITFAQAGTASSWGIATRSWGEPATWGGELSYRF